MHSVEHKHRSYARIAGWKLNFPIYSCSGAEILIIFHLIIKITASVTEL